jgi:hypothetical protein
MAHVKLSPVATTLAKMAISRKTSVQQLDLGLPIFIGMTQSYADLLYQAAREDGASFTAENVQSYLQALYGIGYAYETDRLASAWQHYLRGLTRKEVLAFADEITANCPTIGDVARYLNTRISQIRQEGHIFSRVKSPHL